MFSKKHKQSKNHPIRKLLQDQGLGKGRPELGALTKVGGEEVASWMEASGQRAWPGARMGNQASDNPKIRH